MQKEFCNTIEGKPDGRRMKPRLGAIAAERQVRGYGPRLWCAISARLSIQRRKR